METGSGMGMGKAGMKIRVSSNYDIATWNFAPSAPKMVLATWCAPSSVTSKGRRGELRCTFVLAKPALQDADLRFSKTFSWLDQDDVLTCPVAHLFALARRDDAFEATGIRSAKDFFAVQLEGDRMTFHWKASVRDKPIMRVGCDMDAEEITDSMALRRLSNLGKKTMGYKESLTWYCLRRMALNAVDGIGSEEARNQISGHLDSRTYRAHYMDQQIGIDVIAAVKGHRREDDIIRDVNSMGKSADANAPYELSMEDREAIENLPEMVEAKIALRAASEAVRDVHGTVANGHRARSALYRDYELALKEHHALKQRIRSRWQARRRQEYFEEKDTFLIEAQLHEKPQQPMRRRRVEDCNHRIPERAYLAALARENEDIRTKPLEYRIAAFDALAQLCHRVEPRPTKAQIPVSQSANLTANTSLPAPGCDFPLKCHKLQCLFCIGDTRLSDKDRKQLFSREQVMWNHVRNHIAALQHQDRIPCPHPHCRRERVILEDIQHLKNHGHAVHGVRLQKA